jgi:ATP-dependent DNA ligase
LDEDFLVAMLHPRLSSSFLHPADDGEAHGQATGRGAVELRGQWDGYRALLLRSGDRVRLLSRKDNDLTATYPTIEAAGRKLQG